MTRRVLLPLDGSAIAESLLNRLPVKTSDAEILLLAAVDTREQVDLTGPHVVQENSRKARAYLDEVAAMLDTSGNVVRKLVERGIPAEVIVDVADKEDVSLVCMSTHGRSGVARMMYGSVTEKVVRACNQPVLVVPSFDRTSPDAAPDSRAWRFKSLVVALDGSPQATQIIPHVADMVKRLGSKVTLLMVIEKGTDDEVKNLATKHLEGATRLFADAGVEVTTETCEGDPATEIIDFAPRNDHDLIMMTTHGRTGLSRWMLGSVAEKVVRGASVPVYVVRSEKITS